MSFGQSKNTGSIDVKMDGSVLEEKLRWGLTFSSKLDWGSHIISIAKTASKEIGVLIRSMKFLPPEFPLYKSTYVHEWNTVVMSGLASLVGTWNC